MNRSGDDIRWIPLDGLTVDIIERLAVILAGKPDVPDGVVGLIGRIPPLWDEERFEVW